MRLIIATYNRGKLREIKSIFQDTCWEIFYLGDLFSQKINIVEDGKNFYENAYKKAYTVSLIYPEDFVIGEDSGLEVEVLNNRPGVFSQRFASENATDLENNLKLLGELKGIPWEKRRARYRCVAVIFKDKKIINSFEGQLEGYIIDEFRGDQGFGYDPIFYLPSYNKTVGEISLEEKNKISHRGKAFLKVKEFLMSYCQVK